MKDLLNQLMEAHKDLFKPADKPEGMYYYVLHREGTGDGLSMVIDTREEKTGQLYGDPIHPFTIYYGTTFDDTPLIEGFMDDTGMVKSTQPILNKLMLVQALFEQMEAQGEEWKPESVQEAHRDLFQGMSPEEQEGAKDAQKDYEEEHGYAGMGDGTDGLNELEAETWQDFEELFTAAMEEVGKQLSRSGIDNEELDWLMNRLYMLGTEEDEEDDTGEMLFDWISAQITAGYNTAFHEDTEDDIR